MTNPLAAFDCLAIGTRLQRLFGSVATSELHLFGYLACLLSLYRGRSVADWEYRFAATTVEGPFSAEIEGAIEDLRSVGLLQGSPPLLTVGDDGECEYRSLCRLRVNAERDVFIEGACASALSMPVGAVRSAVSQDPVLRSAAELHTSGMLLEDTGLRLLHHQFSALSQVVGVDVPDLMVPAVVWIAYLNRVSGLSQPCPEAST